MTDNYWTRLNERRYGRRGVLTAAAAGGLGAGALALVGCGGDDNKSDSSSTGGSASPAASTEKPVAGGTLRVMANIGSLLDPHRTNTPAESIDIMGRVCNMLIRFGVKGDNVGLPEGDLAVGLPETPDAGLTLTFKLRPEAKWQNKAPVNGRQVTAEDVKLSIERIKDPATVSPRAGGFANIDAINVIDATTLQFKMKTPQADILNVLADQYNLILPKEITSRGKDAIKGVADVIGSGGYELTAFEATQKFSLKRRADGYWRKDAAWLDGFEYTHQTDPQQLANAMRAGQVDLVGLPVDIIKTFQNDKGYNITRALGVTRECLLINHGKDPYKKDVRIRQAIWRAINRQQIYDNVFGGAGTPGGAMTPAATAWVLPDTELAKLPGWGKREDELKEAKKLLEAAGYPNGFEDTITTVTAFDTEKINDIIVANLAEIGIKLKTENVGTDFATNFLPREVAREYQMCSTLFLVGGYPDAQLNLMHHTDTKNKGTRNYGDYGNAELDAKLDAQSKIFDIKQRQAAVYDIQKYIAANPGPGWIGSRAGFALWNARVQNPKSFGFAAGHWGAENVWIKA